MKKLNLIFILLALLSLSYGCKKDKDNDEDDNVTSSFTVKINGVLWTGTTNVAIHTSSGNLGQISTSNQNSTEQIIISFSGSGTGTYSVNTDYNTMTFFIGQNEFSSMFNPVQNGELIITKYDAVNGKISGTFHCVAMDIEDNVYTVTEGTFKNISLASV
jgi:hypothetical protein